MDNFCKKERKKEKKRDLFCENEIILHFLENWKTYWIFSVLPNFSLEFRCGPGQNYLLDASWIMIWMVAKVHLNFLGGKLITMKFVLAIYNFRGLKCLSGNKSWMEKGKITTCNLASFSRETALLDSPCLEQRVISTWVVIHSRRRDSI